ncbi:MAG: hypothetical protein IKW20_04615 [Bacteroidales bacterium]|nr:hypothetical protein [Bacteroidales bacterium]
MKQAIKQAVQTLIGEKRRQGDVLPFATSIEVAHLLGVKSPEVERASKEIEEIEIVKTDNHEIYYEV